MFYNATLRNRIFSLLEPPNPDYISLLDWTTKYRSSLIRGRAFELETHQYLKAIYQDDCREMVIEKAGQVGISEYLISYILWSCDIRQATGLYIFPTDTHVSDFSTARIGPAISPDASTYLAGIVSQAGHGRVDRVGLKSVRNRFLYLRGAGIKPDGRAPQLKSIDADVVVLDERDEMSDRAEALARERLGHSSISEIRIASTPTYPSVGIHKLYAQTDRRRWHIKCQHCGNFQTLELTDLVKEFDPIGRPIEWYKDAEKQPVMICRKCSKALDRLSPGEWVAEDPNNPVHGYHLSRLYMTHKPLVDIIEGLRSDDDTKRKETYNQGLGLPYRPPSSVSLSETTLDLCRRDYVTRLPGKGARVYMGVDVGVMLHVVIREKMPDGSTEARFIGMVKAFDLELAQLMERYQVRLCVIDALPETRSARTFQANAGQGKVWLCYYGEKKHTEPSEVWSVKDWTVNADRTRTLDTTLAGFISAGRGEPGKTLPANMRGNPDYYKQITALERVLEKSADGNQVARYIGDPDHYAHAENYCDIAMRSPMDMGWTRGQG